MAERILVVDPLDAWLMLLAATLFASAAYVFFTIIRPLKEQE
jgi:putative membrane protein